ncbi:MAG: hypothetical protein ACI85Q_000917 [Salibacteraceae bacterium]|jgi:hypothetical protein
MNLPSFDFSNWRDHPTDNRYTVFFYKTKDESDFFQQLLIENKYWFEYNFDESTPNQSHYIAVNKNKERPIIKLNHLAVGAFRKPFIESNIIRYSLIVFMLTVLTIGVIGYLKSH